MSDLLLRQHTIVDSDVRNHTLKFTSGPFGALPDGQDFAMSSSADSWNRDIFLEFPINVDRKSARTLKLSFRVILSPSSDFSGKVYGLSTIGRIISRTTMGTFNPALSS